MKRSLASALLALSFTTGNAATFTVTSLSDTGAGSLRNAIAQANTTPGTNTIDFAVAGTITLTTGQIDITNALNIAGPGQSQLIIDGNATGRIFRTFSVNNNCPAPSGSSDFLVSISGLTLRNGFLPNGFNGGAIIARTSLALDSVTIRDNVAQWGGGVMFFTQYAGQALTITNSQFINNIAKPNLANNGPGNYRGGGALSATDNCGGRTPSSMTITGSTFIGNRLIPDPSPNVLAGGGAIALHFAGPVVIEDTRMVDNHADSNPLSLNIGMNGGAISANAASLTVRRSEISQNSADYVGGITALNEDPSLQTGGTAMQFLVVDSTFSGNVANQTFGGIAAAGNVAAKISNSTVAANVATALSDGPPIGGIGVGVTDPSQSVPTLQLVSSIVASGQNSYADILAFEVPVPVTVAASNSLIQVPDASVNLVGIGNLTGMDPLLAPLAFNGGDTRTHELMLGSPAIATGSNPLNLATDQRGFGFPRTFNGMTDMGAFQSAAGSVYSRNYVQKSYVAYYGRPADPLGQDYWATRMDAEGGSLNAIIHSFGNSDEFNRRYGTLGDPELVTKLYQQALARDPDPFGLAYYVGELMAGNRTLQTITLDVLNGATTPPDSTVVANKLVVADYFTAKVALGCSYFPEQVGVDSIAGVTADPATVIAAIAAIDTLCAP